MKYVMENLNELTDSREIMESRPYPFTIIFIYIVISILLSALLWCYFSEKEVVVKANGIVRPTKDVNKIINKVGGRIVSVNVKNGDKVKQSQVLYTIQHDDLDLQKSSTEKQIDTVKKELDNLNKLKKSVQEGKNYFNKDSADEIRFFEEYEKYEADYKAAGASASSTQAQLKNITDNLNNLNSLMEAINSETNNFDESNANYHSFLDYQLNVSQYQDKVDQAQKKYDTQQKLKNYIAANDIDDARNQLQSAKQDLAKYKAEYKLNIQNSILQNQQKLSEIKQTPLNQHTADEISQINSSIKTDEDNLKKLEDTLKNININIDDCIVKSPEDGVVNMLTQVNKSDLLQSGVEVATIVPDDTSKYKVQLTISNGDIANIKAGQSIKYHFTALPYKDYGYLNGTITKVSADSLVDNNTGISYYNAEASVENKALYNRKKEKGEIKTGMTCEAQIITRKERVLYYLLEKVNLKD
ncbi:MAG: HlyD family efflux transporter periplasmic adaptor subunit [Clostridiaceae bacterium]|nr:HlyD family efflux transporter periplasmic adaptor subunit [Clostridiaceae bacterium]